MKHILLPVALALIPVALAYADPTCRTPPKQASICDAHSVTKAKLANYALDSCGVSRDLEQSLASSGQLNFSQEQEQQLQKQGVELTSAERLLALMPCDKDKICRDPDRQAVDAAKNLVEVILDFEPQSFRNVSNTTTVAQYFVDPKAVLTCQVGNDGRPIEMPGTSQPKKISWPQNLRVRGSTDGFFFGPDEHQTYAVDKATISSSYSNSNSTRTDKVLAFLGYSLFDPMQRPFYNFFPYVGINRNLTRPTGKPDSVTSDTVEYGLYNTFLFDNASARYTHWVTLRPDFLINHKDDSHLVSASLVYTFVKNCEGSFCLNGYRPFFNDSLYVEPILDGRSDWGHYTRRGDISTTDYRNYWRLGARAGVSFDSAYPYIPLTLTATDVFLDGISGQLPHINYFRSVLSYKLVDKYLSIDLSFSNGRREDTALPEHLWGVALSGAY